VAVERAWRLSGTATSPTRAEHIRDVLRQVQKYRAEHQYACDFHCHLRSSAAVLACRHDRRGALLHRVIRLKVS
jgi:hypothetical protein